MANLQSSYGPLPVATFHIPAPDSANGLPTQSLFFINPDGTVSYWREEAQLDAHGNWDDFRDIESIEDLDVASRRRLLKELQDISL